MAQEQFLTRLTVCELPDETERRAAAWAELILRLRGAPTDLLVLPEMPFVPWTVFTTRVVDPVVWQQALADHDSMVSRFGELAAEVVVGSRPVEHAGRRLNQGFAWTRATGVQSSRSKAYLPDAPDGWEATWFTRGTLDPSPLTCNGVRVGFQLCTEMLFTELSWNIGRAGAQVIAGPTGHRRASSLAPGGLPDGHRLGLLRRVRQSALVRARRLRRSELDRLARGRHPGGDECR